MIKIIKVIFLTLLFIFGITFAVENTEPVVLRYYFDLESVPIPVFLTRWRLKRARNRDMLARFEQLFGEEPS